MRRLQEILNSRGKPGTAVFWLVVQKLRRESVHARTFDGNFELKIMRMRGFSSQFLDNQPENRCKMLTNNAHKDSGIPSLS